MTEKIAKNSRTRETDTLAARGNSTANAAAAKEEESTATITHAFAFANNEIAFLAWQLDVDPLPECLGFHIVREHLDENDKVIESRPLASYVAFKGQHNPKWLAQNTTVWPVQKFTWRDLTLRRRRDAASLRPENERVRYRIRAVGRWREGVERVETIPSSHFDKKLRQRIQHDYDGRPIPLGYLTPAAVTNVVQATMQRKPFILTFTNGILSSQFVLRVLNEDGKIEDGELEARLRTPKDSLREYLAGDILTTMTAFFAPPDARFYAALYELEDEELEGLLAQNTNRLSLILSDAGTDTEKDDGGNKITSYDGRNQAARKKLKKLAKLPGTQFFLQHRMFNGTGHIGHNKFVVRTDKNGVPQAVLTGSTNWTYSGVAGQSNNCIVIEDRDVAQQFIDYWERLRKDVQKVPRPETAKTNNAQGDGLKEANQAPGIISGNGFSIETWFSPNMPGKQQQPGKSARPVAPPPDMARLFSLMRQARRAIFFLVFMPSRGGVNSIVSEAVELGQKDPSLIVTGAISDSQAMWGYQPGKRTDNGKVPANSPHVYLHMGISVIRATAIADKKLIQSLGDFEIAEKLTVGKAIIHDKILVIDPMDQKHCVVAFGSHNQGYRASYANDENMVIVRGHQELALAYTAHVLDVHDHYRFRAIEVAKAAKEKGVGRNSKKWSGFLDPTDAWQDKSSHLLANYFSG
jgi:phosphatidylserine/phosphatidylglycerophosphate/cardiolipin synthase-like enzyme